MTGNDSPALFAGVQTLRYRQSSLTPSGALNTFAIAASCIQLVPNGGAANGIPLNDTMPLTTTPDTRPPVTSASRTCAPAGDASHSTATPAARIEIVCFIEVPFS